jgi:glutamate 5-kinase
MTSELAASAPQPIADPISATFPAMTLVVKLGSSVVATDEGELRAQVLDSICDQIGVLRRDGEQVVLVSSGAIARGMWLRSMPSRPKAMDELQAASAIGQADLFRAYEQRLETEGIEAAQILLTRSDIGRRTNHRNARQTIERLLHWGVVPVVNENDTTATDEINLGDNDFLAAQVAILLHARLLVLLTNTDGLFWSDPRTDPDAELIREVSDFAELEDVGIGQRPSRLGRGGMGSKLAAAEMAAQSGIGVFIGNGRRPTALLDAARGVGIGTRFSPARTSKKTPLFKLWLKYANEPKGSIYVDSGAAERLRRSGSSLLPVGVVDVGGYFEAGDVVAVLTDEREIVGHGMTEFSSGQLARIMGEKTGYVRDHIPDAPAEVIHRDRFVLL